MTLREAIGESGARSKFMKNINPGVVKKTEKALFPDEKVLFAALCNASIEPTAGRPKVDPLNAKGKAAGLFVVTEIRLIWCRSMLGVGAISEIRAKDVASIDGAFNALMQMATLRVRGLTEMFVLDLTRKENDAAKAAIELARTWHHESSGTGSLPGAQNDYTVELERLAGLCAKGVITNEEFASKKKQLLGL